MKYLSLALTFCFLFSAHARLKESEIPKFSQMSNPELVEFLSDINWGDYQKNVLMNERQVVLKLIPELKRKMTSEELQRAVLRKFLQDHESLDYSYIEPIRVSCPGTSLRIHPLGCLLANILTKEESFGMLFELTKFELPLVVSDLKLDRNPKFLRAHLSVNALAALDLIDRSLTQRNYRVIDDSKLFAELMVQMATPGVTLAVFELFKWNKEARGRMMNNPRTRAKLRSTLVEMLQSDDLELVKNVFYMNQFFEIRDADFRAKLEAAKEKHSGDEQFLRAISNWYR